MFASIATQSHKCLSRLGLKFKDADMESSYQKFNAIIERKLLKVSNILSIFLNGLNLILGIIGSNKSIVFRIIVLVVSILGAAINSKAHIISKVLLLFTSLSSLYVVMINFTKFVDSCLPESFYAIGNAFGLIEMVFTFSLGNVYLKVAYSLASFAMKLILLRNGLVERTLWRLILMTIIYILYYVYFSTLERKNYQSIYESREQLRKFQSLLSNDFPSSVLIMSSDFETTLYFNHLFKDKFGANYQQDFVSTIFERFKIDSFSPCSSQDSDQTDTQNLSDFLKMISSGSIKLSDKEVITISATLMNNETTTSYYEIKLRQISWDCKPSYALIFNDISDKQLVMALKIADQHKDRIIATVSHELRTPINGILGLLEMASDRTFDRTLIGYLDYCKSCSKLLLYLVNAILDLSQIRHNSLKIVKNNVNVTELLDEVRSLYIYSAHQKGVEFILEKDPAVPKEIYTDKYRLIEILINLLGNAMKFTQKGFVKLKVSTDANTNERLTFSVEDTGMGIKETDKSQLFKLFGKIEHVDKNINSHGAGLGLTIANELVKALNNGVQEEKILFESEFEKGSRFWFTIDITENPSKDNVIQEIEEIHSMSINSDSYQLKEYFNVCQSPVKQIERHVTHELFSEGTNPFGTFMKESKEDEEFLVIPQQVNTVVGKEILLVDDNPLNLLAASFILKKLGHSVIKACSGQECLELLKESVKNGNHFALVLTDIQMPVMDGLEMSRKITEMIRKKEVYSVPVVALTAKKLNKEEREMYRENGILKSLEKPLVKEQVEKVIKDLAVL